MVGKIKNLVQWDYSRETPVYLIFCLLIVVFIFATPKSWFEKRERLATHTSRIIVQQRDYSPERATLERRVRDISGNPNAEIVEINERIVAGGEKVYEIDIK